MPNPKEEHGKTSLSSQRHAFFSVASMVESGEEEIEDQTIRLEDLYNNTIIQKLITSNILPLEFIASVRAVKGNAYLKEMLLACSNIIVANLLKNRRLTLYSIVCLLNEKMEFAHVKNVAYFIADYGLNILDPHYLKNISQMYLNNFNHPTEARSNEAPSLYLSR